jgi:hypothetical protein
LVFMAIWITRRWTSRRIMMSMSGFIALLSIPIWSAFDQASWTCTFLLRAILVILGVLFCAPVRLWAMQLGQYNSRATLTFVGYALGCQIFGAPTAVIGIWLFHLTGWIGVAGIYPAALALLVCYSLYTEQRNVRAVQI